jgi:outer membrane cobalamin receptor
LQGRVIDAESLQTVPGVVLRVLSADGSATRHGMSDVHGRFHFADLAPGRWQLQARSLAYHPARIPVDITDSLTTLDLVVTPLPLVMDEVVVHARQAERQHTAAFVEHLQVDQVAAPGADLPRILEQASGVDIRRYGGLGAFSSLSIRGSTSEQVLVFLDGVPLNQAVGGGVDLGTLTAGGIESVDVYRGAVPGRFGGNSLGGVVHLRSRPPGGSPRVHLLTQAGAFGTWQQSASVAGRLHDWDGLALVDFSHSDNNFRFWDDNGTEYNPADDEWSTRRNSDFSALRVLLRAARHVGTARLQLSHTQDVSHRGLPGIGNFQALETRLDTRRGISEANLFGPFAAGRAGYRMKAYQSTERVEYRDLLGEVGIGTQHDRNTTRGSGLRAEGNLLLGPTLATLFAGLRHERFTPEALLEQLPTSGSNRRSGTAAGGEVEFAALSRRLVVNTGLQFERLDDDFALLEDAAAKQQSHAQTLWSSSLGLSVDLGAGWAAQAHVGRYGRPPGFFELFGDRGAVMGNADLLSETGRNIDGGLIFRGIPKPTGLLLVEVVAYDNRVDDLIRFMQNSQRVSRPHNIGRARMRGLESRAQGILATRLRLEGSYTRQAATNRSPFSYENGNDLPNAPTHRLRSRVDLDIPGTRLHYEVSHESRHYLDRANLQPVAARRVHTIGARVPAGDSVTFAVEIRNLTDNQVADLWGYPLPGRAAFFSLDIDLSLTGN